MTDDGGHFPVKCNLFQGCNFFIFYFQSKDSFSFKDMGENRTGCQVDTQLWSLLLYLNVFFCIRVAVVSVSLLRVMVTEGKRNNR